MEIKKLLGICIVLLLIHVSHVNGETKCTEINFEDIKIKGDLKDNLVRGGVAPDETIEIEELKIKNKIDRDLIVMVEVILYNVNKDKEIEKIRYDPVKIDAYDFRKFDFELKVPKEINEDEVYNLKIQTYENIEKPKNCDEKYIVIDIGSEYKLGFFQKIFNWFKNTIE